MIRQNTTNFDVLKGSKAWWKRVDTLSQRRSRPANFCLDNELLTRLNDYFETLCHHAPTKSVIKPKNQWMQAKNECCVQLSLVLRERLNHNCTEIPCEQ